VSLLRLDVGCGRGDLLRLLRDGGFCFIAPYTHEATHGFVLAARGQERSARPLLLESATVARRIALVGMSCQSSVPPVMKQRRAGKVARRLSLNIGLLCSKTFDDAIFDELLDAKYGLKRADIKKMNIKGRLQIWMHDGGYHEVPLKECHAWTREGCKQCPDFAAEHADISTGGIGAFNDWTLTIVRTEAGREVMDGMLAEGWIYVRPGDDDPGALAAQGLRHDDAQITAAGELG